MNMKKNVWLILVVLALLGMFFVPLQAYSVQLGPRISLPNVGRNPSLPSRLPGYPMPDPSFPHRLPSYSLAHPALLGKPRIQLSISEIPAPVIPIQNKTSATEIVVAPIEIRIIAPKTLSSVRGKPLAVQTIQVLFDSPERSQDPEPMVDPSVPAPKRETQPSPENAPHITLPESDLEEEIGIK
jgi:hypothetical protein